MTRIVCFTCTLQAVWSDSDGVSSVGIVMERQGLYGKALDRLLEMLGYDMSSSSDSSDASASPDQDLQAQQQTAAADADEEYKPPKAIPDWHQLL